MLDINLNFGTQVDGIFVIHPPRPQARGYRFEYHEKTGKVYVINLSKTVEKKGKPHLRAEVLAEHVDHHARAFGFVQTWCRGLVEGMQLPSLQPGELIVAPSTS